MSGNLIDRVRDFAAYIVIGLVLIAAIIWTSGQTDKSGSDVIGKWGGLILTTIVVFSYTIREHRMYFKRLSFWALFCLLLLLHLVVFIVMLRSIEEWRVSWWVIILPLEIFLVGSVFMLTGYPAASRSELDRH